MAGPIAARLLGAAQGGILAAGFVGASIVLPPTWCPTTCFPSRAPPAW
jgi:hypothetical protein